PAPAPPAIALTRSPPVAPPAPAVTASPPSAATVMAAPVTIIATPPPLAATVVTHVVMAHTRAYLVRQNPEPAFLRLIEALIERLSGIDELFEQSPGAAHHVGSPSQALERIIARRLGVALRQSLAACLGASAERLLE